MAIVDRRHSVSEGTAIKAPCRVATTANITLSGEQTIDGVAVVADDRVLVKSQTDATTNGIYECSTGNWTRTRDFDGSYDIVKGTLIRVTSGSVNIGYWEVTTSNPIVIDTTSIAFAMTNNSILGVSAFVETLLGVADATAFYAALGGLQISTSELDDSAVTTAKIADSNVTTAKIADLNVTTDKLAALSVTAAKIAAGVVGNTQLATGTLVGRAYYEYTTATAGGLSGNTPFDSTIPQVGEGNSIFSQTYTPQSTTNRLRITWFGNISNTSALHATAHLHLNSVANASAAWVKFTTTDNVTDMSGTYEYVPGVVTSQNINLRVGCSAGNSYINQKTDGGTAGAAMNRWTMLIEELKE